MKPSLSQKPARTRKSATQRKTEIVDAALRLAAEIGPDRLTTERLAQEIGLSQAGIFRHFATKADIWKAVAQRIGAMIQETTGPAAVANGTPPEFLRKMVSDHLGFISTTPAIPAILFSRELHAENEELRGFFAGMMVKRQSAFSDQITAGIRDGLFDPHLDADDAAALVLGLIQGIAMRWSLSARGFDLVAEGEKLFALQMRSFRNCPGGQG